MSFSDSCSFSFSSGAFINWWEQWKKLHQYNLDHHEIDDKSGLNSFRICEPVLRSTQSLLLSPQPERAELWASPPPPWALWWSERWGLHSPRRGWRFSWLCLRNVVWTESPRSYQLLDSLSLSWLSCCCRQDCPEDKKTGRTAPKFFYVKICNKVGHISAQLEQSRHQNGRNLWVKPSVARWGLSLCMAQTWPSPFLQTDQPEPK